MIWQMDLEDQRLVIKVVPTAIRISELPALQIPVLSNEVVITHAEDKPLIVISD
jgi:hypothetical protein